MKAKFFLPALLALPLGLLAFKPSESVTSAKLENLQRVDYQTLQGKEALLLGDGIIVRKSTVSRNPETSSVTSEAAVTSFAAISVDNVSLAAFVKTHE